MAALGWEREMTKLSQCTPLRNTTVGSAWRSVQVKDGAIEAAPEDLVDSYQESVFQQSNRSLQDYKHESAGSCGVKKLEAGHFL